ncbi:MAG: four-carbon acid sugar kinase family protein [Pseudooceanicola sp.]|nr:four-carbon acid sugar kinase family protein [Pseudooceanicola sp.]
MMVRAVFIGDDFTGASDTLASFARAGWRARLFLDAPDPAACEGFDVVGIATALRAMGPDEAAGVIGGLWPSIAALSPEILHFKVCSTFDSSPAIGSIGAVALDLERRFRPDHLAVIGGQPSLGRHCVFGTLFARGPDGAVHRLDRHPVMAHHPVTPMGEADLRRLLARQGLDDLALVTAGETPALPLRALFDASRAEDIDWIARHLNPLPGRKLLIGASSVAEVLTQGETPAAIAPPPPPPHPGVLLFAGSRSPLTRQQVAAADGFDTLRLSANDLHAPETLVAAARARLEQGKAVLIHTDPDEDYGLSPDALAHRGARILRAIVEASPVGWLGVAGGDTSSRICTELGFSAIDTIGALAPGVSLCGASHAAPERDGMRLMLKGGQMGGSDLFNQFLAVARGSA